MRYCPKCLAEYAGQSSICPDCDIVLADSPRENHESFNETDLPRFCPNCQIRYDHTRILCPDCDVRLAHSSDVAMRFADVRGMRDLWLWIKSGKPYAFWRCPKCHARFDDRRICPSCSVGMRKGNKLQKAFVTFGSVLGTLLAVAITSPGSASTSTSAAASWYMLGFILSVAAALFLFEANRRAMIGGAIAAPVAALVLSPGNYDPTNLLLEALAGFLAVSVLIALLADRGISDRWFSGGRFGGLGDFDIGDGGP